MRIVYTDGGVLHCNKATIEGDALYCDEIYVVPLNEIDSIEDDEE